MADGRVLIVGAGIGGLVLARALRLHCPGVRVRLLERQPAFGDQGAGITLASNPMAVLAALGLDEALLAAGARLDRMVVGDWHGKALTETRLAEVVPERAAVAIHRTDLHRILAEGVEVVFGAGVEAIEDTGDGVEVRESDGTRDRWDLVVGADGIGSTVRELAVPGAPVRRYAGYTCWRLVVDDPVGLDHAVELWGPGARAGLVPIGPAGQPRVYVFLVENAPAGTWQAPTDRAGLRARFGAWEPRVGAMLDALGDGPLLHHDIEELAGITWGRGRVALLGDAAHAMTPNMGQGAAMAIEDAWVLAEAVAVNGPGPAAREALAARRQQRVAWVQQTSQRLGALAQWELAWARWLRDRLVAATPASVGAKQMERLARGGPVPV